MSLYHISCHQLRVYKDHFIINDVFRKVYIYPQTSSLSLKYFIIFDHYRHIIEMVDSYSCLRLDNKHVFQVEVYEDKDRQKFFEFGNKKKTKVIDLTQYNVNFEMEEHQLSLKEHQLKDDVDLKWKNISYH